MPPLSLQPIKDALAKATPMPWYHQRAMSDEESGQPGGTPDCVVTDGGEDERYNVFDIPTPEDCVAVILLRNNASAMIDRIEELEKENDLIRSSKESITEDVLTFRKEITRLTRENEAYREAMKEVDGIPMIDVNIGGEFPEQYPMKSQRDAILSKLKERLAV